MSDGQSRPRGRPRIGWRERLMKDTSMIPASFKADWLDARLKKVELMKKYQRGHSTLTLWAHSLGLPTRHAPKTGPDARPRRKPNPTRANLLKIKMMRAQGVRMSPPPPPRNAVQQAVERLTARGIHPVIRKRLVTERKEDEGIYIVGRQEMSVDDMVALANTPANDRVGVLGNRGVHAG